MSFARPTEPYLTFLLLFSVSLQEFAARGVACGEALVYELKMLQHAHKGVIVNNSRHPSLYTDDLYFSQMKTDKMKLC